MTRYRSPMPLTCLLTTLIVTLDGSKGIRNQHGSSLGLHRPLATLSGCVDSRRECHYWRCSKKYVRLRCPLKCGLCKPPSNTSPTTTHFSSTIKTPTTHFSSTAKTPTTHDDTTEQLPNTHFSTNAKAPSTHSSTKAKAPTTSFSTMKSKTPKEELVTTRHGVQTTIHNTETTRISFSPSAAPEITSTEQRLTENPTTNQTSNESPNAYATYSKSELDVAMVTSIALGCLLVIALVTLLFICRRRKKRRSAALPEIIVTMQSFNPRDKPHDTSANNAATKIYEELHGNEGTHDQLTSHKQLTYDLKDEEPFYYVLEGQTQHQSFQNQHLYACADSSCHENKAFDLPGQTVNSQSRPERGKDDFEKPYYHVLEERNSNYLGNCDGITTLPVYQPLIGVKRDAMGNTTENCNVYQPLTGIRSKGAKIT